MIELPAQNRGFFCTKCGSDVCKPETITQPHPPCAKCGYLGFAADRGYTADQLSTYGDQCAAEVRADALQALERQKQPNDLDYAKAQVRSAGYSLVSAEFISNFAEFIQDWRKGDFALPKLAALDVEACFDAWQKEVNQNEVKPVLQALERVLDVETLIDDLSEWSRHVVEDTAHESLEKHVKRVLANHGITPPESKG